MSRFIDEEKVGKALIDRHWAAHLLGIIARITGCVLLANYSQWRVFSWFSALVIGQWIVLSVTNRLSFRCQSNFSQGAKSKPGVHPAKKIALTFYFIQTIV